MIRRFFGLTANVFPGLFDALLSLSALQSRELVPRLRSRTGRTSVQRIPASPAVLARHASQDFQKGPQMDRGLVVLEAQPLCPDLQARGPSEPDHCRPIS